MKNTTESDNGILSWDDLQSQNPLLYECKGIPVSRTTLDEDNFEENPSISLTLSLLKEIQMRVDNPLCAVSFEDILGLTQEFAIMLQNSSVNLHLNPEVFEDPLNRGDALGNVKMISKHWSPRDHRILRFLGLTLLDLCHECRLIFERLSRFDRSSDELSFSLGDWDDTASEDILAAKKRISMLRRDYESAERRSEKLYIILSKTRARLHKEQVARLGLQLDQKLLDRAYNFLLRKADTIPRLQNSCSESNGRIRSRPRKSVDERIRDSQTNCLKW